MTERSEQNQKLLDTLFLDGGNATYLEQMQAKFAENPNSVDPSFRAYFSSLGEDQSNAKKNAEGPVWKREAITSDPTPELTSALTGDWGDAAKAVEKVKAAKPKLSDSEAEQAAKDSLHALMLIRAYRARGHLVADLDPLGLQKPDPHPELEIASYGFGPEDMEREIRLSTFDKDLNFILAEHGKAAAIEAYQAGTGSDLAEALAYVENLEKA